MKISKIISFILIFFSCSQAIGMELELKFDKTFGFEIETTAIKANVAKGSNSKTYFSLQEKDKDLLSLITDTVDELGTVFDEVNIEIKTEGGLNKEGFLTAANIVPKLLNFLVTYKNKKIEKSNFENLFFNNKINWKFESDKTNTILIPDKSRDQKEKKVRPQITIGLEISIIPKLFEYLQTKEQANIKRFMEDKNYQKWKNLNTDSTKGFACLFSFYQYMLFDYYEGEKVQTEQYGPKSRLTVMSRVPFSQMYEKLNEKDKNEIEIFFNALQKKDVKIIEYSDTNAQPVPEEKRVKLEQWITSIKGNGKDLLSPPYIGEEDDVEYSMGLLDYNGKAILELRGYPKSEYTFNTIEDFLKEEIEQLEKL